MEAIMIAGVAVVVVGGWYSTVDMLADMGIRAGKRSRAAVPKKHGGHLYDRRVPVQQRVKRWRG